MSTDDASLADDAGVSLGTMDGDGRSLAVGAALAPAGGGGCPEPLMTAMTTTSAPTTIPAAAMNSQLEIPPLPSSAGSARRAVCRGGAAGPGGGAAAGVTSGMTSGRALLTGVAPASFEPHFWQKVRVAGLAVPQVAHRTSGASAAAGTEASPAGAGGAAVRSVPQLPQNWSPATLTVPQRGQVTDPEADWLIGA
jgi:hypothetical protein